MDVNFIKNIAAHISSVPPLPAAAQKLIQLTSKQDVDIQEVTQVIAMDQGIASKLLQVVNSPFYGLQKKVTTIPQAITFLGLDAIKSLALGVSVIKRSSDQKGAAYFTQEEFWKHSLSTAVLSKKIALLFAYEDPEEAFIAGLMHDIGKLVLLEFSGDNYVLALEQASKGKKSLSFYEEEIFEIDHALLGEELCRHWMIPEKISKAIACHHLPLLEQNPQVEKEVNELGAIVSVANQLAHLLGLGKSGNPMISLELIQYLSHKKIGFEMLMKTIQSAKKEISDSATMFGFKENNEEVFSGKIALSLGNDLEKKMLQILLASQNAVFEDFVNEHLSDYSQLIYDSEFDVPLLNSVKEKNLKVFNFSEWKKEHMFEAYYDVLSLQKLLYSL